MIHNGKTIEEESTPRFTEKTSVTTVTAMMTTNYNKEIKTLEYELV